MRSLAFRSAIVMCSVISVKKGNLCIRCICIPIKVFRFGSKFLERSCTFEISRIVCDRINPVFQNVCTTPRPKPSLFNCK